MAAGNARVKLGGERQPARAGAGPRSPWLWITVVVGLSFLVRSGRGADCPRAAGSSPTSLSTSDLARSIADGHLPAVRGTITLGWGVDLPIDPSRRRGSSSRNGLDEELPRTLVITPIVMSLAAVPAYLLAMPRGRSTRCAARRCRRRPCADDGLDRLRHDGERGISFVPPRPLWLMARAVRSPTVAAQGISIRRPHASRAGPRPRGGPRARVRRGSRHVRDPARRAGRGGRTSYGSRRPPSCWGSASSESADVVARRMERRRCWQGTPRPGGHLVLSAEVPYVSSACSLVGCSSWSGCCSVRGERRHDRGRPVSSRRFRAVPALRVDRLAGDRGDARSRRDRRYRDCHRRRGRGSTRGTSSTSRPCCSPSASRTVRGETRNADAWRRSS